MSHHTRRRRASDGDGEFRPGAATSPNEFDIFDSGYQSDEFSLEISDRSVRSCFAEGSTSCKIVCCNLVPECAADIGKPDARDRSSSDSDKELIDTTSTSCKSHFCSSYSFKEPSKWRRTRIKMLCMIVAVSLGAFTNLKTLSSFGLFRRESTRAALLAAFHEHSAFVSLQTSVVDVMLSEAAARSEVELSRQCQQLMVRRTVECLGRLICSWSIGAGRR